MLRIYAIDSTPQEAQAVFEHEGFKISCTTIMSRIPELRVFNKDHKDVTDNLFPSGQFLVANVENFLKAVAAINHLISLPDEPV